MCAIHLKHCDVFLYLLADTWLDGIRLNRHETLRHPPLYSLAVIGAMRVIMLAFDPLCTIPMKSCVALSL